MFGVQTNATFCSISDVNPLLLSVQTLKHCEVQNYPQHFNMTNSEKQTNASYSMQLMTNWKVLPNTSAWSV